MSKKKHNGSNTTVKTFYSLKNQTKISYRTEAERFLMAQLEYDTTVDSYQPFQTRAMHAQTSSELEASLGFIVNRNGNEEAVIISDILALTQKPANAAASEMQISSRPAADSSNRIKLTAMRPDDILSNIQARNVSFLYRFALNPPKIEDCRAVQDYFSFAEESSIKRIKAFLKIENEIYFLLFHWGLRADIANEPITDETIVRLGPLMGGILKGTLLGKSSLQRGRP